MLSRYASKEKKQGVKPVRTLPIKVIFLSFVLCFSVGVSHSQTSEDITKVVNHFLSELNEDELDKVSFSFGDTLRTKWTNLPVGLAQRPGLQYGSLSEKSKIAFHHILTTLFSSQGYLKSTSIMNLDDILNVVYETAFTRGLIDKETLQEVKDLQWSLGNYFVSLWGKPNDIEPWGLKFEGHHISINLTVDRDKYSLTPMFLGTDPAEVSTTKYAGLRVLSKEEDYGLLLINSLSKEQKAVATLSQEVPGDIITNPSASQRIDDFYGIKASRMTDKQKYILTLLIKEFVNNLEHEKANEYFTKIEKSGIDDIYFAWIGSYARKKPHYYVIHGRDFIIEYDNVGWLKDGNHIHSIWREKDNDFGEDILKNHYKTHRH
jgi:hypothetical protein